MDDLEFVEPEDEHSHWRIWHWPNEEMALCNIGEVKTRLAVRWYSWKVRSFTMGKEAICRSGHS